MLDKSPAKNSGSLDREKSLDLVGYYEKGKALEVGGLWRMKYKQIRFEASKSSGK